MQATANTNSSGFLTGLLSERVRRELSAAFGKPFRFLTNEERGALGCDPSEDSEQPEFARGLPVGVRHWGPRVVSINSAQRMLAVPIAQNGSVVAIAVATFPAEDSPRQLIQIATLVLEKIQSQDVIERLQRENEEHLVQATQDLEELSFLRSISGYLKVTDESQGIWSLARQMLPALRHSVCAENVLFVGALNCDDGTTIPAPPVLQEGASPISEERCFELIERLQTRDRGETVVRNRLRISQPPDFSHIRNLVLVPLRKEREILAWLLAINRSEVPETVDDARWALSQHEFGTNEATLMESAASILATHEVNVSLLREKERLVTNVVLALVTTIEAKDKYTRGHSERVARFAKCLGRQLELPSEACEKLYLTGLVHDVGKIGVSDAILKKVSALTDAEFEEIKRHPDEGWAILRDVEQLAYVLPGVLYHHERYDGRGYPDGLQGEDIPLDGRIIAVADAYDAMTSDRAYRKGRSQEDAEAVLRDGAGTQWDPKVIDAFFSVKDEIARLRRDYRTVSKPQRKRGTVELLEEALSEEAVCAV